MTVHLRWLILVGANVQMFLIAVSSVQAIKRAPAVEATERPESVLITARNSNNEELGKCSGVLIGPNVVLTAAHSLGKFDTWEVTAPYAKGGPITVTVKTARLHPDFQRDPVPNDLAVLILSRNIDIERGFPQLHDGELLPIGTKYAVIGRVSNGRLSPNRLYEGLGEIVSFPGNTNVYGGHPQMVEEGDSGGPVFHGGKARTLIGLVSGKLGASRGNVRTDAFTPIQRKNRAWIARQLASSNDQPDAKTGR